MKPRKFAIGDIHGSYRALVQCLYRSGFNKDVDTLIFLGDAADGWSEVPQAIEELLSIKNLIPILGNHDDWTRQWMKFGIAQDMWLQQGGQVTKDAYDIYHPDLKAKHEKEFFNKQLYYYVDEENRLFVHGGLDWKIPIEANNKSNLIWDRHLYETALFWQFQHDMNDISLHKVEQFKEVFIGHTTTNYNLSYKYNNYIPTDKPLNVSNVWNLDQGAGYEGKLTIMDIDNKEYWQSDNVRDLYPEEKGRR